MFGRLLRVLINNRWSPGKTQLEVVYVPNLWCHSEKSTDSSNAALLVKLLGITEKCAANIIKTYPTRKKISHQIVRSHDVCVKNGLDNETLRQYPKLLLIEPDTLEERISFIKDAGCRQLTARVINSLYSMVQLSVTDLKKQNVLPQDADVRNNLLSCLEKPPPHVPPVELFTDDLSLYSIYDNILRYYLTWRLELTNKQLEVIMNSHTRHKYQSLTLIREMLDITENEIKISKDKLKIQHVILSRNPSNTRRILNSIRNIDGLDVKAMITRNPRLLHQPVENLMDKINLFRENGFRDFAISNFPEVLSYSLKTLTERLVEFHSIPQLKPFWSHPRVLALISNLPVVKKRLTILNDLNVRCSSLHLLSATPRWFNMYILTGGDRTRGKDMLRFLSYELGVDKKLVHKAITRHPFWCQIPFHHSQETFCLLTDQNYSNEAILDNLQIVLYRSSLIAAELNNIESTTYTQLGELSQSQKLALCLYNIEKKFHFDGNGVWNCEKENKEEQQDPQSVRQSSGV